MNKLLVIVPTRNRPDLAKAAIHSVIDQKNERVGLWVSDNSNQAESAQELEQFCHDVNAEHQLVYLRPDNPLPMAEHWDWILNRAIDCGGYSHVLILTDRMMVQRGALQQLTQVVHKLPDDVITYSIDTVDDEVFPYTLSQRPWTGRILRIASKPYASYSLRQTWPDELPRLLNCVVPLSLLQKVKTSYGSICLSMSPDLCCGYRLLNLQSTFIRLDRSMLVEQGQPQSNGKSLLRSPSLNKHAKDFLKEMGGVALNADAPMPGIRTNCAALYHEYAGARKAGIMPKVNTVIFLRLLRRQINRHPDKQHKAEVLERMRSSVLNSRTGKIREWLGYVCMVLGNRLHPRVLTCTLWARLLRMSPNKEFCKRRRGRNTTLQATSPLEVLHEVPPPPPRYSGPADIERRLGAVKLAMRAADQYVVNTG